MKRPNSILQRRQPLTQWRCAVAVTLALLGLSVAQCRAAVLPSCFPPVEVSHAKIVRVERNGVLVLEDGRAAKLEGILLPASAADRAPELYAAQAIARLSELVTGRTAVLAAQPPKEDRYGRLRAQVLISGSPKADWLQRALLEQGLARVDIAPDRGECAADLYAAEARARAGRAGLWSAGAYAVRGHSDVGDDAGTFQIVEGTIARVTAGGGRIYLEFGPARGKGFAVAISSDDQKIFRAIGVDPYSYEGETVRVRGWIDRLRRPEMDIATPADIEIISTTALRGSIAAPR